MKAYNLIIAICLSAIIDTGCARRNYSGTLSANESKAMITLPEAYQNIVFKGIIPCADCPGIETELVFQDSSYHLSSIYQERETSPITQQGLYSWDPKKQIVRLDNGKRFQLDDTQLFMLNNDGQRIKGSLSKHYILTRSSKMNTHSLMQQLGEISWFLKSLNGENTEAKQWTEEPFIKFSPTEKTIHGNAGCNTFFGSYTINADTLILAEIACTKRFCANMFIEDQLLKLLSSDCKIELKGDLLTITNLESNTTALFKMVAAKQP